MNAFSLRVIGNRLKKKGWEVIYWDYFSVFSSFDQNVDGLHRLWQKHMSDSTHLLGHSLGGLLVLAMMNKYRLTHLPRTVLMGSPVNGSAVVKKMLLSRLGRFVLGKSAQPLLSGVSVDNHNGENSAAQNKIGVIIGSKEIGIGHLIQQLPKPHDGVVAFEEAKMETAEDQIVLPVTHASMLISRKIPEVIDRYLSTGVFGLLD